MDNRYFLNVSIRLIVAWLSISLLGLVASRQIISLFVPYFNGIVDILLVEFDTVVKLVTSENKDLVYLGATAVRPIVENGVIVVSPGQLVTSAADVIHTLVPIVILYSALVAWPVPKVRDRMTLIMLGIPLVFIMLGFITPVHLAGLIEMTIYNRAYKSSADFSEPLLISWVVFLESGGRWLIPLATAIVGVMINHRISKLWKDPKIIFRDEARHKKSKREKKREKKQRREQSVFDREKAARSSEAKSGA